MTKHLFQFLFFLFSFLFFLSYGACKNPAHTSTAEKVGKYGKIQIIAQAKTKPEKNSRTVLPSPVFDKYTYTFIKTGQTAGTELTPDNSGLFTLDIGSYSVEVKAYIGMEGSYSLAASGVSQQFTISPGDNEPVIVPLSAVTQGQGLFSYTVTFPADAWAEIILEQWHGEDDIYLSPSPVAGINGLTEMLELEAGTYLLTVQVNKGVHTAGITEVIYIYPFLTTEYAKDFVDEDFHAPSQTITPDIFLFYWIDEHDSLITTNSNQVTISLDETLAITAQRSGFVVQDWFLNGVSTGQTGETYYFSSSSTGNHTVGLFVVKEGKPYNTNITITVEAAAAVITRSVTVDMYDNIGDGWQGSGAIRINLNGINIANVKVSISNSQNVPVGQKYTNTFTFPAVTGDVVKMYWVAGISQGDNSFIVYYTDTPPIPAFCTDNKGTQRWTGDNALIYKIRGAAPDGLANETDGALLGEFTVN